MKQSRTDSLLESVANVATGYLISWAVWLWVIGPVFGIRQSAGQAFLVVSVFTITSLFRQYLLRRLFDGRTPGQVLVNLYHRRKYNADRP